MSRKAAFISIVVALTLAGPLLLAGQQTFTMKKDVVVEADETQDNVISLGGNVIVRGKVKDTVFCLGGNITISGEIGKAVIGIGSQVTLTSTAVVNGDVVSLGGTLEKETGSRVRGDTVYFRSEEIRARFLKDGLFKGLLSFSFYPIFLIIKLVMVFIWLILALLCAALFPRQIALASDQVRTSFWPVLGVGLLATILFSGLVIIAAVLSLILIGIPFLIALIWVGLIIKIFGRVVLFYFFGESLLRSLGSKKTTAMGAVLMGLLLVSIIDFIPILGSLFTFVLSLIGWGVVIRTKFGTRENWFARK